MMSRIRWQGFFRIVMHWWNVGTWDCRNKVIVDGKCPVSSVCASWAGLRLREKSSISRWLLQILHWTLQMNLQSKLFRSSWRTKRYGQLQRSGYWRRFAVNTLGRNGRNHSWWLCAESSSGWNVGRCHFCCNSKLQRQILNEIWDSVKKWTRV